MISTSKLTTSHGVSPRNYQISADKTVNKMSTPYWIGIVFLVLNISQDTEKGWNVRPGCTVLMESVTRIMCISQIPCQLSNIEGLT